mgnify:CR=1 FL=1
MTYWLVHSYVWNCDNVRKGTKHALGEIRGEAALLVALHGEQLLLAHDHGAKRGLQRRQLGRPVAASSRRRRPRDVELQDAPGPPADGGDLRAHRPRCTSPPPPPPPLRRPRRLPPGRRPRCPPPRCAASARTAPPPRATPPCLSVATTYVRWWHACMRLWEYETIELTRTRDAEGTRPRSVSRWALMRSRRLYYASLWLLLAQVHSGAAAKHSTSNPSSASSPLRAATISTNG